MNRRFVLALGATAICAGLFGSAVTLWWVSEPERSAEDQLLYDSCLMDRNGNKVACDALMRVIEHGRAVQAAEAARAAEYRSKAADIKSKISALLAGGFTKREVADWALDHGLIGQEIAGLIGLSDKDVQDIEFEWHLGKYAHKKPATESDKSPAETQNK
jgi:hypothetical protein